MSIAGGLHRALERGYAIGCTSVQIFSHNPRGWRATAISTEDAGLFRETRSRLDMGPVFVHTSYLINIASPKKDLREKSLAMLREEMLRADTIGAEYVVLHTGTAHDGEGRERAIKSIRQALGGLGVSSSLLIENTSGKRGDISSTVKDLADIIDGTSGLVFGVCLDSCHAYAAGYDLSTQEGGDTLAGEVMKYLGESSVRLLHLNDSKGEMGSGTDRHEHLGHGRIGLKGLGFFVKQKVFGEAPAILETPKESNDDDLKNLRILRSLLS
jgi:deoxyribonuclease-4